MNKRHSWDKIGLQWSCFRRMKNKRKHERICLRASLLLLDDQFARVLWGYFHTCTLFVPSGEQLEFKFYQASPRWNVNCQLSGFQPPVVDILWEQCLVAEIMHLKKYIYVWQVIESADVCVGNSKWLSSRGAPCCFMVLYDLKKRCGCSPRFQFAKVSFSSVSFVEPLVNYVGCTSTQAWNWHFWSIWK